MGAKAKDDVQDSFNRRLGKRIVTFAFVDFAWVFFGGGSLASCLRYLSPNADYISDNKYL